MKNHSQCTEGLLYNNFSLIYFQTFFVRDTNIQTNVFINPISEGGIDEQLFTRNIDVINRYNLKGFDISVDIGKENPVHLEGYVAVMLTTFFHRTYELSYRIIVPNDGETKQFCKSSRAFNTDQLITLAALIQKVEHWESDDKGIQRICGSVEKLEIRNLPLDADSNYQNNNSEVITSLEEVQRRYRNYFCNENEDFQIEDHHYVFLDVWESLSHEGKQKDFSNMNEEDIIEHIELHHKSELIGLMSFYPEEWPFRMEDSFNDICGENIAIDVDDLVLANENMCVIFGTYGLRGEDAPTDWKKHLMRRNNYHVSWPEYLVIIEILLAKKYMINYVLNKYINNSHLAVDGNIDSIIEKNAFLSIKLSKIILQLDSFRYLRYMSHKHMFQATNRRLRIDEDEKQLDKIFSHIDNSLNNANNMVQLKEANASKYILLFISFASLFGVLLAGDEVKVYSILSQSLGKIAAIFLVIITTLGIIIGIIHLIRTNRQQNKLRNNQDF
ncbi:MAG: hypothetical protein J6R62_03935 [Rikenellaceae bacterium]|nr:hypothetical protein [Rikenellaceae bacterium]